MIDIGNALKQLRMRNGYTQEEAAAYISKHHGEITRKAVQKWEGGTSKPNPYQFLLLCQYYKVDDVLGTFGLSGALASLNEAGQAKVREYIDILVASGMFRAETVATLRKLPLYNLPASAGTGEFLDGDSYDLVEVGDMVPLDADFGIRLAGDSMAPRFTDGQIVWVHRQQSLQDGEIGIFALNGTAYCKKLDSSGRVRLVSLNSKYKPIEIGETDELRVFGKVI